MPHILVIESKYTGSLGLVAAALAAGHDVTFVAHDPTPYLKGRPLRDTPLARTRVLKGVRTGNAEELAALAARLHRDHPIDACLTISEQHLHSAAAVAELLGLVHEPPDRIRLLRNKHEVRAVLREAGLPQPDFAFAESVRDAVRAADEIGYPVVVKPIDGSGSIDVGRCADAAAVNRQAAAIVGRSEYGRSVRSSGQMLVEQYVPGPLVSVELLTQHGRHRPYGRTDKMVDARTGTVELGGTFSAVLDEANDDVVRVAVAAVAALGIETAITHTELILGPDGPVLVEVNGRLVGGPVPEAADLVLHRSIYADLLDLHLGRPVAPPLVSGAVSLRAVVVDRPGTLIRFDLDRLVADGTAELCLQDRNAGDHVQPPVSNRDRLGFVACVGRDAAESVARADRAANLAAAAAVIEAEAAPARVLMVDRVGYDQYRGPAGEPALDPDRFRVSLLTPARFAAHARPGECTEVIGIDVLSEQPRDAVIRALHEAHPYDLLLAFTERLLLPMAAVREVLGIRGPDVAQTRLVRDKAVMKRAIGRAGIPLCEWAEVGSAAAAEPMLAKHGRVVVKPTAGIGSNGVAVCDTAEQLAEIWRRRPGFTGLVEQFVPDEMLHVDAIMYRGEFLMSSVSRYLTPTTSFQTASPLMSVMIDDRVLHEQAAEFCRRSAQALGITDSVLHLEVFHRPTDGRMFFCEMAARAGGGGITTCVRAVTGFNLYQAMVQLAIGERPAAGFPITDGAAGFLLLYGRPGILTELNDADIPSEWVLERRQAARPGDPTGYASMSGEGLIGYVVGGKNEGEVTKRMRRMIELCKIDIDPQQS